MSDQDKIICSCANLSEKKINNYFESKNNKVPSFKQFLNETKAGTYCTACRLDLETIFIKKNIGDANFQNIELSKNLSIKKNFYNIIDKIFPKLTLRNQNFFPILYIKNKVFDQAIWITNMEIISERLKSKIKIGDVEVTINLFNSIGKKVWTTIDIVKVNSRGIFKIPSDKILEREKDISIGWIEVLRKFKINCSKGTTRPQIMVYSENSNCSVHGQDVGYIDGSSHSSIFRPNIDIQILSFINPSNKIVKIIIEPPVEINEKFENKNSNSLKIQLPAKGSRVHVINEDERFKFLDGKYFTISWKGSGKYKSHVYCVSKNFRFVSLDHL